MWSQKEAVTGPPLALTEELLIGVGEHKKVYVHPDDETLCVKVLHYGETDEDWQKELRYRRSRARRGLSSTLLTRYTARVRSKAAELVIFLNASVILTGRTAFRSNSILI